MYIVGDFTLEMNYVQSDAGPKQEGRDPGPTSGVVQGTIGNSRRVRTNRREGLAAIISFVGSRRSLWAFSG